MTGELIFATTLAWLQLGSSRGQLSRNWPRKNITFKAANVTKIDLDDLTQYLLSVGNACAPGESLPPLPGLDNAGTGVIPSICHLGLTASFHIWICPHWGQSTSSGTTWETDLICS